MRILKDLTIRTRLMLMLLVVTLICCITLSYRGSQYGERVITEETTNQLNYIRSSKKEQILTYLESITNFVEVMGHNETIFQATKDFRHAYQLLATKKLSQECNRSLDDYYQTYVDRMSRNIDIRPDIDLFLPESTEACYLQYQYIIQNPYPMGEKQKLKVAKDSSLYSKIHQKHHEHFKLMIEKFKFYDVFLVDLDRGDILYTVFKETDFATNLYTGPYRTSHLADLVRRLRTNRDFDEPIWSDFSAYRPSYGKPACFVGIPLSEHGETAGGLIFQVATEGIDDIMTSGRDWENKGLGKTGETFLIGDDEKMRSISRFFLQDSVGYAERLLASGEHQEYVDRLYRMGTTIVNQRLQSEAVEKVLEGHTGLLIDENYRGKKSLISYEPLGFDGLNWGIIAEEEIAESFLSVYNFNRRMLTETIILMVLVILLALLMSNLFVKPIEKLAEGAKRIREGDASYKVKIDSKNEFGNLAKSFNLMVAELDVQRNELWEKSANNESLLLSFVPEIFAERLKKGEKVFAEKYDNLSLIGVDIVGFSELTEEIGQDKSVEWLNDIVVAFDETGMEHYIDKIKTVGDIYFAACGLFEPRLDHARQIVQFAQKLQNIIERFNVSHGTHLRLHISLHCGTLVAGLVGSDRFSFDVWGNSVNLIFRMIELDIDDEIVVSEDLVKRLSEHYKFEPLEEVTKTGHQVFKLIDENRKPKSKFKLNANNKNKLVK